MDDWLHGDEFVKDAKEAVDAYEALKLARLPHVAVLPRARVATRNRELLWRRGRGEGKGQNLSRSPTILEASQGQFA